MSTARRDRLEAAGILDPGRATQREGLVSRWLGLEPTGEEAFVGHRLVKTRGAQESVLPASPGVGRPRTPEGVSRENKLVRASQGRLRQSTHVALQDWQASETYANSVRSRDDLAQMGHAFTGRLGKDEMLVNPKGRPVPAHWRSDPLARLDPADEEAARQMADGILGSFLADSDRADQLLQAAAEQGVRWDELRVVKRSQVERYFGQFARPGKAGKVGRAYDAAIDATAASIIFGRIGYVPKNVVQNVVMALPHQGVFALVNLPRSAQVLADDELRPLLSGEVGTGATGALGKEFQSTLRGVPSKVTGAVSSVADTPFRISAFLHEAAAEGVISRINPVLTANDREALIELVTSKANRAKLNDIRSRSVEAMADFSRLTPKQRRSLRRLLVIPGWLVAGSRYPVHFAATHPLRSAALAYAAAGEPYADRLGLPQNQPINEYFARACRRGCKASTPATAACSARRRLAR